MKAAILAAAILSTGLATSALAVPIEFDERATFDDQGAIGELQDFEGFDGNESFTGYSLSGFDFVQLDNAALGTAAIPAPPALMLVLMGMLSVGVAKRKQQMRL